MQVSVAHVSIANGVYYGAVWLIGEEASFDTAFLGGVNKAVEFTQGERDVIFVHTTPVKASFRDAFAPGPKGLYVGLALGLDAVRDDLRGNKVLKKGFQLSHVMVVVGPAGFDEDVEWVSLG